MVIFLQTNRFTFKNHHCLFISAFAAAALVMFAFTGTGFGIRTAASRGGGDAAAAAVLLWSANGTQCGCHRLCCTFLLVRLWGWGGGWLVSMFATATAACICRAARLGLVEGWRRIGGGGRTRRGHRRLGFAGQWHRIVGNNNSGCGYGCTSCCPAGRGFAAASVTLPNVLLIVGCLLVGNGRMPWALSSSCNRTMPSLFS